MSGSGDMSGRGIMGRGHDPLPVSTPALDFDRVMTYGALSQQFSRNRAEQFTNYVPPKV